MFFDIDIPKHFEILQKRDDVLELKSCYHYWRLTKGAETLILSHKYKITHPYHKQFTFSSPEAAIRYIIRHDRYFSQKTIQ